MGLLENQTVDIQPRDSINPKMDKYSMFAAKSLLQQIYKRKEEKEKSFIETSNEIKHSAKKLINEIKLQEEQLLNELWKKCRQELAELQRCHTELKRKLTDMIKIHEGIRKQTIVNTIGEERNRNMHQQLKIQVEHEIESLSTEGKKVLHSTDKVLMFEKNGHHLHIGELSEMKITAIEDSEKSSLFCRQRSNTFINVPDIPEAYGKSTLRKARSTNDLSLPTQQLSLVFQMSNEDLLSSSQDDIHSNIDPHIHFIINQQGKALGQIQSPMDVTFLPDGNLLITEHDNHRLQVFDIENGNPIKLLQSIKLTPCGITLTKDGYIVVTDQANNTIKALTRSGELVCQFGTGYFKDISFIAAKSNDNYIVIDNMGAWQQCVFAYNAMTGVKTRIGYNSKGNYILNHPEYICIDKNSNIIISDGGSHCIWVFDKLGNLQFNFGQQGDQSGDLCYPKGVCVTEKGHFIVADCGNHRVCQFDNQGNYIKTLLSEQHGISYPQVVQIRDSYLVIVQGSDIIVCKL